MSRADAHPKNVFEWLDHVRARLGMYIDREDRPVQQLEALICGYYSALWVRGVVEPVPAMNHHFSGWMRYRGYGFAATERGWGVAIESMAVESNPLSVFFDLVSHYRQLVPAVVSTVSLSERHAPTGKRVTVGVNGRIIRPDRVDVVQYTPDPLHFLRFHYGSRLEDQRILDTTTLRAETTPEIARAWVGDEFGVTANDWETPT